MIIIDEEAGCVRVQERGRAAEVFPLASAQAFRIVSRAWLRVGWDNKHVFSFTWQGRPVIQLPEDLIRLQEVIFTIRPDVIIETGVAHGGSLVFHATLYEIGSPAGLAETDAHLRFASPGAAGSGSTAARRW